MIRVGDSLNYRIARTSRLLRRHLADMTQEVDELTPEQWFVLNRLRNDGACSQVALGDQALMDRPNISRIVGHLERRNWVQRSVDPDDGRRQLVGLTDEGRKVHDRIAKAVPGARAAIFEGIEPEELETAKRVLSKMEENLSKMI